MIQNSNNMQQPQGKSDLNIACEPNNTRNDEELLHLGKENLIPDLNLDPNDDDEHGIHIDLDNSVGLSFEPQIEDLMNNQLSKSLFIYFS